MRSVRTRPPGAARLGTFAPAPRPAGGWSRDEEVVSAPAPPRLRRRRAAQAHKGVFDRKHPADLNRGFGRPEEPRRNGSHLVCLSESERRRRPWRWRERLQGYTAQGLPLSPPPPLTLSPPPRATHPSRLPAEIQVSGQADPYLGSGSLPPPCSSPAVLLSGRGPRGREWRWGGDRHRAPTPACCCQPRAAPGARVPRVPSPGPALAWGVLAAPGRAPLRPSD